MMTSGDEEAKRMDSTGRERCCEGADGYFEALRDAFLEALVNMLIAIPFAVCSIFFGFGGPAASSACIASPAAPLGPLTYRTWLAVDGIGLLCGAYVNLLSVCVLATDVRLGTLLRRWVRVVDGLFGIAWGIVGAVLLFTTVVPTCQSEPIYAYGLVLFALGVLSTASTLKDAAGRCRRHAPVAAEDGSRGIREYVEGP
jgi:hypothetical protein